VYRSEWWNGGGEVAGQGARHRGGRHSPLQLNNTEKHLRALEFFNKTEEKKPGGITTKKNKHPY